MSILANLGSFFRRIELRGNWLFFQIAATYAAFWTAAYFMEKPWLANIVTVLALAAGIFLCLRYVPKSLSIILCKERGQYGAHDAVLGTAEIGVGLMWGGVYRVFYYNIFENPGAWTGSGLAIFSLFLIAKGVLRVAISPSTIGEDFRLPENTLQLGTLAVGALIGAVIAKVFF